MTTRMKSPKYRTFTETQVVQRLEAALQEAGSLRRWSAEHGIPASVVSEVRHGKIPPPPQVLRALGLIKTTVYVQELTSAGARP